MTKHPLTASVPGMYAALVRHYIHLQTRLGKNRDVVQPGLVRLALDRAIALEDDDEAAAAEALYTECVRCIALRKHDITFRDDVATMAAASRTYEDLRDKHSARQLAS